MASTALNMPALLNVIEQITSNPALFGVPPAVIQQVNLIGKAREAENQAETADAAVASAEGHIGRIKSLQGKIQEVEVQASIREVQVKILEIKIKQVPLPAVTGTVVCPCKMK